MNNRDIQEKKYFTFRNFEQEKSKGESKVDFPSYIHALLPKHKNAKMLDIGCGFGGFLGQLRHAGYHDLHGIDIYDDAITFCKKEGYKVQKTESIVEFCKSYNGQKFDFIVMTHVIEHIKKSDIIETLTSIRSILSPDGSFYLTTPNAQSRSGCYWAYEDFTHEVIFTSGSLYYVLSAAGFTSVTFVDQDNIENSKIKFIKKILLFLYKKNDHFWNKITGAAYHPKSPNIYSWELKVCAK
jgi:cyclopropane fatty-acyl-phospholipid synthase-like methyltransferase